MMLPRPFLKWAGGKSKLASIIHSLMPPNFNAAKHTYYEPFLGGGALFFYLQPKNAIISDYNPALINTYKIVQNNLAQLVIFLKIHSNLHSKEYYYKIRHRDREKDFDSSTNTSRAARLIYLNKTCYNGLYRLNKKGEFNVPLGKYQNPNICDTDTLFAAAKALQEKEIIYCDFEAAAAWTRRGDFVYFDPPYIPLNLTSSFTAYTKQDFNLEAHKRLRDVCLELHKKGVQFIVSNSYTDATIDLYSDRIFTHRTVETRRMINSKASGRKPVEELLIMNY